MRRVIKSTNFRLMQINKRAVSPVIAIVLMIAITVAVSAVVYSVTFNTVNKPNVELLIDDYGVADTDADGSGDLIQMQIRNVGADVAKISSIKLYKDNVLQTSWTLVVSSYTINSVGIIKIQTLQTSQQVTKFNTVRVEVKDSTAGALAIKELRIPDVLSTLPVLFNGGDFSTININQGGWTTITYNTHGGGAGISVSGTDLVFQTNDDLLFYLQNDTFMVQNGIITTEWLWGDNDGIGIAFRIVDFKNYYWVGFTEDHNGPANRAGETESTFDGPWFVNDGKFELHKLVNGVDTLLAATTTNPFSIPPGTPSNPSGPFEFVISFTGDSIAFQAAGTTGPLEEIFSITDTTFPNAGYFGVFSLAAQSSILSNFQVTA